MNLLRFGDPIVLTEKGARLMREPADRKGIVVADQQRGAVQVFVRLEGQKKSRGLPVGWVQRAEP